MKREVCFTAHRYLPLNADLALFNQLRCSSDNFYVTSLRVWHLGYHGK